MSKLNMYQAIRKYGGGDVIRNANFTLNSNMNPTLATDISENNKKLGINTNYTPNFELSGNMDYSLARSISENNKKLGVNTDYTPTHKSNYLNGTPLNVDLGIEKPELTTMTPDIKDEIKQKSIFSGLGNKIGGLAMDNAEVISEGIDAYASSKGHETNFMDTGMKTAGTALLKSGNPWGMAAGAATLAAQKVGEFSSDKVQGFSGNTGSSGFADMTMQDKSFSTISDYLLPGSGLFSSSALSRNYADQMNRQMSDYTKAQSLVNQGKQDILAANQSQDDLNIRRQINLGGVDDNQLAKTLMAKNGGELKKLNICIVDKFKEGGSVIPNGALHARKHNIDKDDLKGSITNKGVPVITKDDDGIFQHAEVEKEEMILSLDITNKIQKLREIGDEESMIKAGKIFAEELMTNTEDNVGLIKDTIKNDNKNKNK